MHHIIERKKKTREIIGLHGCHLHGQARKTWVRHIHWLNELNETWEIRYWDTATFQSLCSPMRYLSYLTNPWILGSLPCLHLYPSYHHKTTNAPNIGKIIIIIIVIKFLKKWGWNNVYIVLKSYPTWCMVSKNILYGVGEGLFILSVL